jgi:hypothetical protein
MPVTREQAMPSDYRRLCWQKRARESQHCNRWCRQKKSKRIATLLSIVLAKKSERIASRWLLLPLISAGRESLGERGAKSRLTPEIVA